MKVKTALFTCSLVLAGLWAWQLWFENWTQTRTETRSLSLIRPLSECPYDIGGWLGRDVELDPEVVRVADANQVLRRDYTNADGETIGVYMTYYAGLRRFIPHGPGTCYPMGGWKLRRALTLHDKRRDPAWQLFFFEKELDRHLVLYTYFVNGKRLASTSWTRLRFAAGLLGGARGSIVQVELLANVLGDLSDSRRRLQAFAEELAPVLENFIPQKDEPLPLGRNQERILIE